MNVEQKALELVNKGASGRHRCKTLDEAGAPILRIRLREAIEAHEADKRRFSEAVQEAIEGCGHDGMKAGYIRAKFADFIIPQADPLGDVLRAAGYAVSPDDLECLHNALDARGLAIMAKVEA